MRRDFGRSLLRLVAANSHTARAETSALLSKTVGDLPEGRKSQDFEKVEPGG